jgi:hypothetical protein
MENNDAECHSVQPRWAMPIKVSVETPHGKENIDSIISDQETPPKENLTTPKAKASGQETPIEEKRKHRVPREAASDQDTERIKVHRPTSKPGWDKKNPGKLVALYRIRDSRKIRRRRSSKPCRVKRLNRTKRKIYRAPKRSRVGSK